MIQSFKQKKFYQKTPYLFPLGVFVWGDGLVVLPFWATVCLLAAVISAHILIVSALIFWIIRAVVEIQYWLHVQFDLSDRETGKHERLYRLCSAEPWFVFQVAWQMILVTLVIISLIYIPYFLRNSQHILSIG